MAFGLFGRGAGAAGSTGQILLGADPVKDSFGIGSLDHVLGTLLDHRIRLSEEREVTRSVTL